MSRVTRKSEAMTHLRQNGDNRVGSLNKPFNTASSEKQKLSSSAKSKPTTLTPPPELDLPECVNKIYLEYVSAEKYIRNFLTERDFNQVVEDRKKLTRAITALHATSIDLLDASLTAFSRLSIDHRIFKVSINQIVNAGRLAIVSQPLRKSDIQRVVSLFLEKGLKHLEDLRQRILSKCPYTPNPFHGGADFSDSSTAKSEAAKICYPRILLCIGDTHRYANSLKLALESYEQARSIDPGNGLAYHQLGLMALLQRDFLSAAYDFLRATFSPAPVEGAKQQLQIAFDEALKTYNKTSSTFWFQAGKITGKSNREAVGKEVWIFPPRIQKVPPLPDGLDTKERHWYKLSAQELSNRFSLTFVLVIGKLWTNVGMENIHVVAEESLVYLEGLLQRRATFTPRKILQVESLLMMLLDQLRPKGSSSIVWITAIQYAMEVCTVISDRLSKLIDLCDWDSPQMEALATGLFTWVTWMEAHGKDWTHRRPRPVFSINHAERLKEDIILDRLDDTYKSFAFLMTKLTLVFRRFSTSLFPSVLNSNEDGKHNEVLSPFPEAKHLFGLSPVASCCIFHQKHCCDSKLRISRGRNYVRLNSIFRFALLFLHEKYGILELRSVNGVEEFFSRVKVKRAYAESEIGGLDSGHHHYMLTSWGSNSDDNAKANRSTRPRVGDVNNACRLILRPLTEETENPKQTVRVTKSPVNLSTRVVQHKRTFALWERFTNEGFRTDIIIEPRNFVLDTNCFVRRLGMIKVLVGLSIYPLFIPVTVILELKGLSKGGLRKKDHLRYGTDMRNAVAQQKLVDGMELGKNCLEALSFIAQNMNYFRIITSTGTTVRVKTPHAFVQDDHFDPTDNNDDRILQSCRKLEELDYELRDRDTTRRIYRRTVLLTGDRCLRLKSNLSYYIPARAITPVVFWLISQCSIKFFLSVTKMLKEIREKRTLKRKQKWEKSKALRNASSSPAPKLPELPKFKAILQHPNTRAFY